MNCDLPNDYTSYVHRVGRTGRLTQGFATSFFDPSEINDQQLAMDIMKVFRYLIISKLIFIKYRFRA